ncbi:N-acetylmuramoyl-L-alanine amidase [Ruminococcus sp. NK3A76]|uniref:N-acetylmuramoyl-L-alanine amidase n=1 Tax=Ruminococcus sp. NK3A76 TaxID=877411 RepID=UPI0006918021|nr:N-acetylmuramoyl-L-alanine amidase [Ruminococcus sp. NK3A76]
MRFRKLTAFALSLIAAAAVVSGANDFKPVTAHAAKDAVVQAADEVTENVSVDAKVTAQANGTVTLGWNAAEGAKKYCVYEMTDDGKQELLATVKDGSLSCTLKNVTGGVTHIYAVVAVIDTNKDVAYNCEWFETEVEQPLYAPEFSLTAYSQSIKISWKQSYGATSYRIYSYDPATKKYTKIHTSYATTRSYTVKNLTPATSYSYVVRAVSNASGKNKLDVKIAPVQSAVTSCITPVFSSLSNEANTVNFKWKTSGDVAGYQIWAKDNDDAQGKYKKLCNVSAKKTEKTVTTELNKNYSFKLRSYKKVNGSWVYSAWSAVKSTYTGIKTPEITSAATSGPNFSISWSASDSSINGYQIWMKASGAAKYVKLCNVSPKKLTAFISENIPAKTDIKLRMRAYQKINGVWVYSPWSKVCEITTGDVPEERTIKIVLDPGHLKGGNRAGNDYDNVWYGYSEATMSLTLAKYMKTYLEGYGFEVTLTRTTDKAYDLSLEDRGLMAKGADFFLSLHSNAAGASAQAVYSYCSVDGKSNKIGRMLSAAVASTMGVPDGGVINLYSDDGKTDYYCVLRNAAKVGVSGVMVEHSYHTNAYSREWLLKDSNLKKLAAAEAKAIAQYYGMI